MVAKLKLLASDIQNVINSNDVLLIAASGSKTKKKLNAILANFDSKN